MLNKAGVIALFFFFFFDNQVDKNPRAPKIKTLESVSFLVYFSYVKFDKKYINILLQSTF